MNAMMSVPPGRTISPCFSRIGFVLLDFANGKGVEFAVMTEKETVTAVSFLERCHDCGLRSITPISDRPLYQDFTKGSVEGKVQGPRH
jgi:hypothetical protein